MVKIIPLKKTLTTALIHKKLLEYSFFAIINAKINTKNKSLFTKSALNNTLLLNFFKLNVVHFPLVLHFFDVKQDFLTFFKQYFNVLIIVKFQNKLLKQFYVSPYMFSASFISRLHYIGIC